MIQIPTNARQQQALLDAHRLRREAFAAVIHTLIGKAGPREETGRSIRQDHEIRRSTAPRSLKWSTR